jgi:predicted DNA-binding protein with PD1-like motif
MGRARVQLRRSGSSYLIRLDRGEQALRILREFANHHRLGFAVVRAIGTFERATLGYHGVADKTYQEKVFEEPLELLNLSGNIARGEDGSTIVHAHVTVSRADYTTLGGHLVEATVGPTLEVVVKAMPISVHRRHDSETALRLLELQSVETVSI